MLYRFSNFNNCPETVTLYVTKNVYCRTAMLVSDLAITKSLQSCPTLCDPIDSSPPGSPIPGILQARVLEWGAIAFSNAWKWKVKVKLLSRVWTSATPWTAAYQAPPSMGFSRQEYWSEVPLLLRPGLWLHQKPGWEHILPISSNLLLLYRYGYCF